MADFASRSKLHGFGYSLPRAAPRRPVAYRREIFHNTQTLFAQCPQVTRGHDCCNDVIKTVTYDDSWNTRLTGCLAEGLEATRNSVVRQSQLKMQRTVSQPDEKPRAITAGTDGEESEEGGNNGKKTSTSTNKSIIGHQGRPRSRLLMTLGCGRGSGDDQFEMPRSVAVDAENGDIYVVDSGNSRVHRYTSSGIRVVTFGCRGTIQPDPSATAVEFRQPSSVVVPAFGSTIVVADREDRRIQVFTKDMTSPYHERLRTFNTVNEPHSLAFDELREQILVGTTLATVEIYDKFTSNDVTLVHQFSVRAEGTVTAREHRSKKTSLCPVQIAVTNTKPQTVLVLDQVLGVVSYYTYDGRLIYHFNPSHDRATYDLAFTPAGLAVDQIGQIIISDGLNQAVGLFDDRGRLVRYVVDPGARDAGPVQAVTVGPEGHFVCTEYSLNGPHCVKVWKYRECPCHGGNTPAKSRKSR